MTGPYQTPLALGRDPLMAFFWVMLAPVLFWTGASLLAQSVIPPIEEGTAQELTAYHTLWRINCLAITLWFGLMSLWSSRVGAGAFAGAMTAAPLWFAIAAFAGPLILILPSVLVGSFMSGSDWIYAQEVNEDVYAPQNWTLMFIALGVVIAPIVEEVAFRGIGLGALVARGLSPVGAAVLTSIAFALSHPHYTFAGMLIVFFSGLGLAALRLMSGTVIVPIVAHISANATAMYLNAVAASPPT